MADQVLLIRHGEKPEDKSKGVDPYGKSDKRSLTPRGWTRAGALLKLFGDAPDINRPTVIYAAAGKQAGERMTQTVQPLADHLNLKVVTRYDKGQIIALTRDLLTSPGVALVSWEHSEIPVIARALGPLAGPVPTTWPDNRYDVTWVLTRNGDRWSFSQVPQLLLAGDKPTLI